MSRHRFVKNMTEDDYYDDYDDDDYEYSEEDYEQETEGRVPDSTKRRFHFELGHKILERRLKLKGLFDFKRASSAIGKSADIISRVVEDAVILNSKASSSMVKPAVNMATTTTTPLGLASMNKGQALPSLASLSLGSTSSNTLSLASLGMSMNASNTGTGGGLSKPPLKLSDLIATPHNALSLSQILNSKPSAAVPPSIALGSLNNQPKFTLTDLMSTSSTAAAEPSPSQRPLASNDSQYQVVASLPSSTLASFLETTAPSTPPFMLSTHTIDLTSFVDGKQVAYSFNDPSPDDIVQQARGNVKKPAATASKSSVTKATPSKKIVASSKESLTNDLKTNLNISSESIKKVTPKQSLKNRIDVAKEYEKRSSEQESLNLVVVGHVDAGKSTLMGHLLVQLGEINTRTIAKFKKEADELKKGSFMYAWVLDATDDERSRGVTIDCAVAHFTTLKKKRRYTLLDAPGHQDFVEKMVAGASQADVAIIVVDAGVGGFESGFDNGGQTREHALLLKALGVGQIIVGINKMDIAGWSEERYNEIREKMLEFLISIVGFEAGDIRFIPLSGFTGDNLCKPMNVKEGSWYEGPTLVDALDVFHVPQRSIDAPFVLSVQDYFKGGIGPGGGGSVTVSGRIDAGSVQVGEYVLAMPINESGSVKAIQMGDESMSQWAVAGDRVSITLSDLDPIKIHLGSVICSPDHPVPTSLKFTATISTFDLDIPLTLGVPIVMHHLGTVEAGTIIAMENSVDSAGNTKKKARVIASRSKATVTIQLERPIICQISSNSLELGRFLLRKGKISVAAGLIEQLL